MFAGCPIRSIQNGVPHDFHIVQARRLPGHVLKLFSALSDKYTKQRVFLDTGQLAVGEKWLATIDKALHESIIFFCAIGAKWESRDLHDPHDFVRREISTALARRKPVVPLLFNGARLPVRDELPEDCRAMLDYQVMAFDPYDLQLYEDKVQKLVSAVEVMTKTLFDVGDTDVVCRLHLSVSSNKGSGSVGFSLRNSQGDITFFQSVPVSGNGIHVISFPVGPHTLKVAEVVSSGREDFGRLKYATEEVLKLSPLPCWSTSRPSSIGSRSPPRSKTSSARPRPSSGREISSLWEWRRSSSSAMRQRLWAMYAEFVGKFRDGPPLSPFADCFQQLSKRAHKYCLWLRVASAVTAGRPAKQAILYALPHFSSLRYKTPRPLWCTGTALVAARSAEGGGRK